MAGISQYQCAYLSEHHQTGTLRLDTLDMLTQELLVLRQSQGTATTAGVPYLCVLLPDRRDHSLRR